jgi:hypothetical protein
VAAVDAVDRVTVMAADQDGPESGVDVGDVAPAVVVGAAGTEADGRRAARHRDEARLALQRELVRTELINSGSVRDSRRRKPVPDVD